MEIKRKAQCRGDLQMWEILISWKLVNWLNRRSESTQTAWKSKVKCSVGVTFKCESFLYRENWLTGSIEEVRGHREHEIKRKAQCRGDLQIWEILISCKLVNWLNRRSERTQTAWKSNVKRRVGVTFKCVRFLYRENWLTGSIEEVRGHTDSMEIKRKAQCRGDLQMWEILISWELVNWLNRRRQRIHRQHWNQT